MCTVCLLRMFVLECKKTVELTTRKWNSTDDRCIEVSRSVRQLMGMVGGNHNKVLTVSVCQILTLQDIINVTRMHWVRFSNECETEKCELDPEMTKASTFFSKTSQHYIEWETHFFSRAMFMLRSQPSNLWTIRIIMTRNNFSNNNI